MSKKRTNDYERKRKKGYEIMDEQLRTTRSRINAQSRNIPIRIRKRGRVVVNIIYMKKARITRSGFSKGNGEEGKEDGPTQVLGHPLLPYTFPAQSPPSRKIMMSIMNEMILKQKGNVQNVKLIMILFPANFDARLHVELEGKYAIGRP